MKSKKAATGEAILTIWRLFLISMIALIILGSSAIFYDYYIDVKNAEAGILTKQVIDCVVKDGVFNLDEFPEEYSKRLLDYCGVKNIDRFFVNVSVYDSNGNLLKEILHGDSGLKWILKIFEEREQEIIRKYKPGFETRDFSVNIIYNKNKIKGELKTEVLINYEE